MEKFHSLSGTERFWGVVQDVSHGIHSNLVVGGVDPHSLLTHGTLIGISGRLLAWYNPPNRNCRIIPREMLPVDAELLGRGGGGSERGGGEGRSNDGTNPSTVVQRR